MTMAFYQLVHLIGIFALLASLCGLAGMTLTHKNIPKEWRKIFAMAHGVSLMFILISGFGLLARLGIITRPPIWVLLKILIWIGLGAGFALLKRQSKHAAKLIVVFVLLATLAAYLAIFKPI
jgi:hypothetical protein